MSPASGSLMKDFEGAEKQPPTWNEEIFDQTALMILVNNISLTQKTEKHWCVFF